MTVFEGTFEEMLKHRAELVGKTLRVIALDEPRLHAPALRTGKERSEAYLARAGKYRALGEKIDDNRDSIYGGTLDDSH